MCVNNLNIVIDFITKSIEKIEKNNFTQLIITTHNYNIINKLKFQNFVLLKVYYEKSAVIVAPGR